MLYVKYHLNMQNNVCSKIFKNINATEMNLSDAD